MATKKPPKKGAGRAAHANSPPKKSEPGSTRSGRAVDPRVLRMWEAVHYWRREMAENALLPLPAKKKLVESVRDSDGSMNLALEALRQAGAMTPNSASLALNHTSDAPLAAFFHLIEHGVMPPPELMLCLLDSYTAYLESSGDSTLEEVFFGPPKRRAGNYAARSASSQRAFRWATRILFRDGGESDLEVAETIVRDEGLDVDPESVLRAARYLLKRVPPEK